jgi:hypothetical protein
MNGPQVSQRGQRILKATTYLVVKDVGFLVIPTFICTIHYLLYLIYLIHTYPKNRTSFMNVHLARVSPKLTS